MRVNATSKVNMDIASKKHGESTS